MSEQHPLLEAYLNGELDDQGFADFNDWLREDPAHLREWAVTSFIAQELGEALSEQIAGAEQSLVIDRIGAVERGQLDAEVLSLLQQIEAGSKDAPLRDLSPATTIDLDGSDSIDFGTAVRELSWAAGKVARHLIASKPALLTGLAAMLMIAVTLVVVFQGDGDGTPGIVMTPETNQTPEKPIAPSQVIATLTAEHNAQWEPDFDYGTPEPGDVFRAGRTVTLLEGFAELTTAKDAVVVLEAPCTIAFDDADNALRLIAGKLVANVPQQAIGFSIHTPTARVIDYGTTFGVDVKTDGTTHAAVFTGEVELRELSESPEQPTRNVRLTEGWASSVSKNGSLRREPKPVTVQDEVRFAKSMDEVVGPGFAYRRAVLANKPLVYWGFDEPAAKTQNLAGQDQWAGHAVGQTGRADGLFGQALKLAGPNMPAGGFTSRTPLPLKMADGYTLEAWYRIDQAHVGRVMSLVNFNTETTSKGSHYSLLEVIDGPELSESKRPYESSLRFMHRNFESDESLWGENLFAKSGATIGEWIHLAAVHEHRRAKLYINGELVSETSDDQPIALDATIQLIVGASAAAFNLKPLETQSNLRTFNGLIDEVALYDHALDTETIQQHFDLGRTVFGP